MKQEVPNYLKTVPHYSVRQRVNEPSRCRVLKESLDTLARCVEFFYFLHSTALHLIPREMLQLQARRVGGKKLRSTLWSPGQLGFDGLLTRKMHLASFWSSRPAAIEMSSLKISAVFLGMTIF